MPSPQSALCVCKMPPSLVPDHAPLNVLRVPSLRLDSYLGGKRKVDLVKIDVEGAELMVFRGASALLALPKEQSPTVIFEYDSNNYARFGYRAGDLFDILRRNGYGILELQRYDTPLSNRQ